MLPPGLAKKASFNSLSYCHDQKEGLTDTETRETEREPKSPLHLIKKVNIRAI